MKEFILENNSQALQMTKQIDAIPQVYNKFDLLKSQIFAKNKIDVKFDLPKKCLGLILFHRHYTIPL